MTSFEPLPRVDSWSAANQQSTVNYRLQAEAVPDVLCRLLNLLAMQYLIVQQLSVSRSEEQLHISLSVGALTWHRAEVIGNRMRNLVDVAWVELEADAGHSPQRADMVATG